MSKKLIALTLTAALTLSSIVPAFAEESISANAQAAKDLGMLKGANSAGVTVEYTKTAPTRLQAAILFLRLKGLESAALSYTGIDNFADAKDVTWAEGKNVMAYLKAHPELGWAGIGNDKFNPNAQVDAKSYYKVMLEALGYKQNTADVIGDFTWDNIVAFAASKGLDDVMSVANFTVDNVATATIEAMKAAIKGSTKTLAASLVEAKIINEDAAVKAGVYTKAPTTLAVDSIKVDNLREIVVTFKSAPVADEAKKASNYTINGNTAEAVTLSEDGMTATVRTSNANKMSNYSTDNKLVIAKAVGFAADTTIDSITAKHTTVPTIASVNVIGPRSIKVTFSEPLTAIAAADAVGSFKFDNGTVALDASAVTFSGRTLTINTLADITEGSHSLELKNTSDNKLIDGNNFVVVPTTVSFAHAKDVNPLTAVIAESNETTVTIKFNKPIDASTLLNNANVLFRHTYNTATNQVDGSAVTNPSGDNQTFVIAFGDSKPLPPGATNLYIKYANTTTAIKDGYGNKLPESTIVVNTIADLTKPVVEKVEFKTATTVEVTFSEVVDAASAELKSNYTLKDSTGAIVTVNNASFKAGSTKVVVLTTATMNGGSYTLAVKDVKDVSIAKNKLDDVTIGFTGTDKVAPTLVDKSAVAGIQGVQIGDKKVKVYFSESMDVSTITEKSNWMFNGAALATDVKIEAVDNNKAVILTFPASLGNTDANSDNILDNQTLTLGRVKDVAGNWIESFQTSIGIVKLAPLTATSAAMTSKNTIKVTFEDEIISGAVIGDFQVSVDGVDYTAAISGIATSVVDGDTVITLTLQNTITNTLGTNVLVQTAGNAQTTGAKNAYGNTIKFTGLTVSDKIAPEVVSVTALDNNSNNKLDTIEIVYTENLYAASVQDSDFTVEGYKVTAVSVSGNKITLSLEEKSVNDFTGTAPKVTQVGEIQDSNRNVLANKVINE